MRPAPSPSCFSRKKRGIAAPRYAIQYFRKNGARPIDRDDTLMLDKAAVGVNPVPVGYRIEREEIGIQ